METSTVSIIQAYLTKPQRVWVMHYNGNNEKDVIEWSNGLITCITDLNGKRLVFGDGVSKIYCHKDDFIVKDAQGNVFPLNPRLLQELYDKLSDHS